VCGVVFEKSRGHVLYCSDECFRKVHKSKNEAAA
jgi:hypothetical protein